MKRFALLLALILCLSACAEIPPPADTAPPQTTVPAESTPPQTTAPVEITLPPETTIPETIPETTPIITDFSEYEEMLAWQEDSTNWLFHALGCVFERPEDIDLNYMFYLGVGHPGSWNDISEESRQKLVGQGFMEEMDLQIMPAEILEEVLLSTFGIDLMSVEMPKEWGYIVTEDAFCSNHNDAYFPSPITITAVEDDGTNIRIHYTAESFWIPDSEEILDTANLILTLVRKEDGTIHAVSNLLPLN